MSHFFCCLQVIFYLFYFIMIHFYHPCKGNFRECKLHGISNREVHNVPIKRLLDSRSFKQTPRRNKVSELKNAFQLDLLQSQQVPCFSLSSNLGKFWAFSVPVKCYRILCEKASTTVTLTALSLLYLHPSMSVHNGSSLSGF